MKITTNEEDRSDPRERHARRPKDALGIPDGLHARDVQRSIDHEELREKAPDIPRERIHRIARIRDELREGTYLTEVRLREAMKRALEDL